MTAPVADPVTWTRREPPLAAAAVAGAGAVGESLRSATIARQADGGTLRAVADEQWIVVLGPVSELPWADGAVYLGWDAGLLLPTTRQPWPPAKILRTALPAAGLVAVLPGHILVSDRPLHPADPGRLGSSR